MCYDEGSANCGEGGSWWSGVETDAAAPRVRNRHPGRLVALLVVGMQPRRARAVGTHPPRDPGVTCGHSAEALNANPLSPSLSFVCTMHIHNEDCLLVLLRNGDCHSLATCFAPILKSPRANVSLLFPQTSLSDDTTFRLVFHFLERYDRTRHPDHDLDQAPGLSSFPSRQR